jgi:hypothetical protein
MDIQVLKDVTPCRLVNIYFHLQGQAMHQRLGLLDREADGTTIVYNCLRAYMA